MLRTPERTTVCQSSEETTHESVADEADKAEKWKDEDSHDVELSGLEAANTITHSFHLLF